MNSVTSRQFREAYAQLPLQIQSQARKAYALFKRNPAHTGLNFKKVDHENSVYYVRIGPGYRALGRVIGQEVVWFWIGSHGDYDKLV